LRYLPVSQPLASGDQASSPSPASRQPDVTVVPLSRPTASPSAIRAATASAIRRLLPAASIARTLLLPAAVRHLADLRAAAVEPLIAESEDLVAKFVEAIMALEKVNAPHPDVDGLRHALYMRDEVVPAMDGVRDIADRLERIVADDLWPLPKYAEMLFIK